MNRPNLSLVSDPSPTLSERRANAQALLNTLAREQREELMAAVSGLIALCEDVAGADSCQVAGVREIARRLGKRLAEEALTLEAITARGLG